MNLCNQCTRGAHQVATQDDRNCDCGCHHVLVLPEFDKETWWLPAEESNDMGHAVKFREKPWPGLLLEYFYREPRPLKQGGPWVEGDTVELDMTQVRALEQLLQSKKD